MKYENEIFRLLRKIPKGKVTTYSEIAKALGNPKLARHVGNVLNRNGRPDEIPCFKVVESNGRAGGYSLGAREKTRRLQLEGIKIENGKVKNLQKQMHRF